MEESYEHDIVTGNIKVEDSVSAPSTIVDRRAIRSDIAISVAQMEPQEL